MGVRVRLEGKEGCLWTIIPNKAVVVQVLSEEQRGPLAENVLTLLPSLILQLLLVSSLYELFCGVRDAVWVV